MAASLLLDGDAQEEAAPNPVDPVGLGAASSTDVSVDASGACSHETSFNSLTSLADSRPHSPADSLLMQQQQQQVKEEEEEVSDFSSGHGHSGSISPTLGSRSLLQQPDLEPQPEPDLLSLYQHLLPGAASRLHERTPASSFSPTQSLPLAAVDPRSTVVALILPLRSKLSAACSDEILPLLDDVCASMDNAVTHTLLLRSVPLCVTLEALRDLFGSFSGTRGDLGADNLRVSSLFTLQYSRVVMLQYSQSSAAAEAFRNMQGRKVDLYVRRGAAAAATDATGSNLADPRLEERWVWTLNDMVFAQVPLQLRHMPPVTLKLSSVPAKSAAGPRLPTDALPPPLQQQTQQPALPEWIAACDDASAVSKSLFAFH